MTSKVAAYRDKEKEAAFSSDDEDEDEEEVSPLLLGQASDDDDDDNVAGKKKNKNKTNGGGRHEPPRPSMLNPRASILPTNNTARRNRRRSSARFMDIRSVGNGRRSSIGSLSSIKSSSSNTVISKKSLGDMYKRVIRMNAENRINASNSWNLKLIDNIDKFLLMDDNDDNDDDSHDKNKQQTTTKGAKSTTSTSTLPSHGRVNFTKASCTLDASVKIYSYRVDDVHLTSYKVLANLHRTDNNNNNTGKNKKKGNNNNDNDDDMDHDSSGGKTSNKARSNKPTGPTLESNLGNLNLSRLDSAFDIDPLFHKMSKTFDEGGAKGLLLANLGVGLEGCDIVFDSTENLDDETKETTTTMGHGGGGKKNGMVDISSLTAKLADSLGDLSLMDLSLVPQLAGLRAEYSQLDEAGYVEAADALASSTTSRSRRYAPEPEEEKEADRSIHQEAMERSRASFAHSLRHDDDDHVNDTGKTPLTQGGDDDDEYAADDFGGGYNDDDDDDAFVNFLATDNNASRFSSGSFTGSVSQQQFESQEASQQTSVLLDAIAAGQLGIGQSDYEYFDASQVHDNAWAGATHWKRASTAAYSNATKTPNKARRESSRTTTTKPTPKKAAKKKKAGAGASNKTGDCVLVNLLQAPVDLDDILRKPQAARKGQRQRAADPLQLTTVAKLTKTDNLLPLDVGIGIEVLSSLFLRPDAALFKQQLQHLQKVASASSTVVVPVKSVGFNMDQVQTFGDYDDGDDDDGGVGYDMGGGGNDDDDDEGGDFFVQELDNVRKVEKVSVGYATVAKKVDVKRLKRDLWAEIESHFDNYNGSDVEEEVDDNDKTDVAAGTAAPHSFQQAVKEMEANKTQMDVTLPYYFICLLHLANEQNLYLESKGLDDFEIHLDNSENDL